MSLIPLMKLRLAGPTHLIGVIFCFRLPTAIAALVCAHSGRAIEMLLQRRLNSMFSHRLPTREEKEMRKFSKDPDAISRLSPDQYRVTQQNVTEAPGTGEYLHNKEPGIYVDIVS